MSNVLLETRELETKARTRNKSNNTLNSSIRSIVEAVQNELSSNEAIEFSEKIKSDIRDGVLKDEILEYTKDNSSKRDDDMDYETHKTHRATSLRDGKAFAR